MYYLYVWNTIPYYLWCPLFLFFLCGGSTFLTFTNVALKCSGKILNVEVVDGGLICSSGVCVEEMGDKNEDCYIVNAAVYVGY